MEPAARWVRLAGGETAGGLSRLPRVQLQVILSAIGLGAEQVHFLGRATRLQSQWADQSQKRRFSPIIDLTLAIPISIHKPKLSVPIITIGKFLIFPV